MLIVSGGSRFQTVATLRSEYAYVLMRAWSCVYSLGLLFHIWEHGVLNLDGIFNLSGNMEILSSPLP